MASNAWPVEEAPALIQVLMLTTYDDGDLIFDSLRAGANGYLLKNMPQEGNGAGRAAGPCRRGADVVAIARKVINHFHVAKPASELEQLTSRELEILRLLAKGHMYKEIADQSGHQHEHRAHPRQRRV
jgi:DNA-binding NarL/FixJ family response regulator